LLGLFSVQSYYIVQDWFTPAPVLDPLASPGESLYLIDQAKVHVRESDEFETKVRAVADRLNIAPEWLMAAIYTESKFDPSVKNHKGSGATGLIQFMVPAVKDLNRRLGTKYYMSDIQAMSATDQLDLVEAYLETIQERYRDFHSLTDVYLAILYPKGLEFGQDEAFFSTPTRAYRQNSGLDENRDGHVTRSDIDARMARIFPTAAAIAIN
ncbi:MAG: transglycosylase SLT domain-containing protein, partial [Bacteroidota bacterium]